MSIRNQNKAQNPMSEYLLKIQSIISNTEFKNKTEADKYETLETRNSGDEYVRAVLETDIFESYTYDPKDVYKMMDGYGYSEDRIFYYINNPHMLPHSVKTELMVSARKRVISNYVERNKYYVCLTGKPFPGTDEHDADEVVLIPDAFYDIYKTDNAIQRNQPIHELPTKYQELFMNSEFYQQTLLDNPNVEYLKYIGSNAIPIHISRPAKDGSILRINTNKLTTYNEIFGTVTVSADIVHGFTKIYNETRDYVYNTLRGNFSTIYPNYDSFIRFLTIYLSIGNALNEFMKKSTSLIYMNNVTANDFFMLYGLPSTIMEGASMIEFLKKFRMILMDKGTNTVYRVKDLIGYEYTDIYTLVMVKQQVFDNGVPKYEYRDGVKVPVQKIVFRRMGTTEDNTSYFKFRETNTEYGVDEITSGDPRWWNTPEVELMLQDMNYTLSNSKYIQLSTHLSMTDIWWQCVILLRGLMDQRHETQYMKLNVNCNVDGSSELSVFDAVLILIILMNWHMVDYKNNTMRGDMYLPNGTYDGKNACLDMMFNGLNQGIKYQKGVQYFKDQLIGLVPSKLYRVTKDFVSNNDPDLTLYQAFNGDIVSNRLELTDVVDGSPKDLKLGLPFKLSSFNFNIREEKPEFYESINTMSYIEPELFMQMLENVLDRKDNNIGEVLMTDIKLIYRYLEDKLRLSSTIQEFRQVTDVFSNLFLVDPVRNWYDELGYDPDIILLDEYNLSQSELDSLKSFFREDAEPELTITYKTKEYPINLYNVLNQNVTDIQINTVYPFRDEGFVDVFKSTMKKFNSSALLTSSISNAIKSNYQNIIIDKTVLDIGNLDGSPNTFESLLFRTNTQLYKYLVSIRDNGESMLLLIRSIVKALESYTNTPLHGLEFSAIGVEQYFHILKEVISYFKSYMVEFTKDEFVYILDGLFDQGGNSNMLHLIDEISNVDIDVLPKDSLTLYDVSSLVSDVKFKDDNSFFMYDDMNVRVETTYQTLLETGYEILYDDGNRISNIKPNIDPSTKIIANLIPNNDSSPLSAYKIIINTNNIEGVLPANYFGNVR